MGSRSAHGKGDLPRRWGVGLRKFSAVSAPRSAVTAVAALWLTIQTFTSAKEVLFSSLFVCWFVCLCLLANLYKNFRIDLHEIFREGWQWTNEKIVKFWWWFHHRLDTGIVFRIRHYWEIQKVVNGHKSRTDSPDGGTDVATLERRALAEVCTVPMLLAV